MAFSDFFQRFIVVEGLDVLNCLHSVHCIRHLKLLGLDVSEDFLLLVRDLLGQHVGQADLRFFVLDVALSLNFFRSCIHKNDLFRFLLL